MSASATEAEGRSSAAVVTIGVLFFIFGFVTWLNGPMITFAKLAFDLDDVGAFLIPMAFYLSYFFLALPASAVLRRTGMKKGMAVGLMIMALGAAAFGECTTTRWYPGALGGLFVMGGGLTILQTASNPYVSIIGPIESGARRIAVMGICNKLAGFLAPLVLGAIALHDVDRFAGEVAAAPTPVAREALLDGFAAQLRLPYLVMTLLLVALAVWIGRSSLPDVRPSEANQVRGAKGGDERLLAFPHLLLGVLCIFLYVGVEVMAGDAIGTYGADLKLSLDATRLFTSATLFAMLAGYVVGLALVPRVFSQERYLAISAGLGVVLTVAAYLSRGYAAVGFIAALGFANAMMWPAIFPLAIRGLGRHTEAGSALLIMGVAGGAVIPYAFAQLKQHYDFQLVYMALCVPAYLYILYYGARGYRAGEARPQK